MTRTTQEEQNDEISNAISRVLYPVMICMSLAILLVKLVETGPNHTCDATVRSITPLSVDFNPGSSASSSSPFAGQAGIIFLAIFLSCIVVFTFALLMLYKHGYVRVIQYWLLGAVFLIFAYVGGVYALQFCRARCFDLDWISLVFIVWNFTVTGLIAVFGTAPRVVNQGFLIVMSALMAFIFRRLPEWINWTLLGALVAWDLFAVLSPFGPLRKLVEIARERGDPLPALVYDTNPNDVGRDEDAQPAVVRRTKEEREQDRERRREAKLARQAEKIEAKQAKERAEAERRAAAAAPRAPDSSEVDEGSSHTTSATGQGDVENTNEASRRGLRFPLSRRKNRTNEAGDAGEGEAMATGQDDVDEDRGVGTLGHHLKLGLGDFVFYSILVVQASQFGSLTTVTSFVAILTGLCSTLFLVTVYRKALPALPISIMLGIVSYFLTRFAIQPFVDSLLEDLLFH